MYLDNVIVFFPSGVQHVNDLHEILRLLHRAGVTLKRDNWAFLKQKERYLGHNIVVVKLAASQELTKAVTDAPLLTDKTLMRSILAT